MFRPSSLNEGSLMLSGIAIAGPVDKLYDAPKSTETKLFISFFIYRSSGNSASPLSYSKFGAHPCVHYRMTFSCLLGFPLGPRSRSAIGTGLSIPIPTSPDCYEAPTDAGNFPRHKSSQMVE